MSLFFTDGQILQILNTCGLNPNNVRTREVNMALERVVDAGVQAFITLINQAYGIPNSEYIDKLTAMWDQYDAGQGVDLADKLDITRDVFMTGMYHGIEQTQRVNGLPSQVQKFRYIGSRPNCPLYHLVKKNVSPAGIARQEDMGGITVYQDSESGKWWYRLDDDFVSRMEPQQ